jgi:hypothetical protein
VAALAPPPLLRRAGLIVDEDGEALDLAQLALHGIELAAVVNGRSGGKIASARIFPGLVRYDGDAVGALGRDLMRDLGDAQPAFGRLAAGHRHRVIVENLVGDIDAGGKRRHAAPTVPNGCRCRPHVLKDMRLAGEGGLPDPGDALAAHMRDGRRAAARDVQRHSVAADAGHGAAAIRDFRR